MFLFGLSLLHKPLDTVKEDTGVQVQRHKLCDSDPISVIDTISHFPIPSLWDYFINHTN